MTGLCLSQWKPYPRQILFCSVFFLVSGLWQGIRSEKGSGGSFSVFILLLSGQSGMWTVILSVYIRSDTNTVFRIWNKLMFARLHICRSNSVLMFMTSVWPKRQPTLKSKRLHFLHPSIRPEVLLRQVMVKRSYQWQHLRSLFIVTSLSS